MRVHNTWWSLSVLGLAFALVASAANAGGVWSTHRPEHRPLPPAYPYHGVPLRAGPMHPHDRPGHWAPIYRIQPVPPPVRFSYPPRHPHGFPGYRYDRGHQHVPRSYFHGPGYHHRDEHRQRDGGRPPQRPPGHSRRPGHGG